MWPMVLSPLMAIVYTQLGPLLFALLAVAIMAASLVARGLSLSTRRLERRVRELDSLQAVGQALSSSLDLQSILSAIHTQVASLMPAHNFYVALYDAGADEVSFPLAIEHGEEVHWRSRKTANGLTEHILRTRSPLLIQRDYDVVLSDLGLDKIGPPAVCWLGVPLLAGDEPLGVIAVQSYSVHQAYDVSHQEVLVTIAAQASVAIQNARLYARTDEALALRVQELDSILHTTQEGILLFDLEYRILAANRAAADMLSTAQLELLGRDLLTELPETGVALTEMVGYGPGALQRECQRLSLRKDDFCREEIVLPGPLQRRAERTLTPVRNRQGETTAWLLAFRDVSEEHELAALREELVDMLVHDLRSPLTVMTSSLELMKAELESGKQDSLAEFLQLAEGSGKRLLRLVNDLLDISRLESGSVSIHPRAVEIVYLMDSVVTRLSPLSTQARIEVGISCQPDLPPIFVDLEMMDRVLHNLLDNAIKFTPDGGHVELWARSDPERRDDFILAGVTDTGPGIPAEAQSRLFKKFQQVVSVVGRRLGTGLGLPYCKLAVEAHGGEIWVESEAGQGSTFVMRLPVAVDSVFSG
jgi:signal transduction histidine kinase